MAAPQDSRSERIHIRATPDQSNLIKAGALKRGESVTDRAISAKIPSGNPARPGFLADLRQKGTQTNKRRWSGRKEYFHAGDGATPPVVYLQKPVLDRNELKGYFDFEYKYDNDEEAHPDVISCIVTSLQALGLKLKPSQGPVETIVIDHAEKPSAN
jgi:uncharacterized protein (TIGR03435 family)